MLVVVHSQIGIMTHQVRANRPNVSIIRLVFVNVSSRRGHAAPLCFGSVSFKSKMRQLGFDSLLWVRQLDTSPFVRRYEVSFLDTFICVFITFLYLLLMSFMSYHSTSTTRNTTHRVRLVR